MIVECLSDAAKFLDESERLPLEIGNLCYDLEVGKKYAVMSIMIRSNRMEFLLCRPGGYPSWVPDGLFSIIDRRIPGYWEISSTRQDRGYEDLFYRHNIKYIFGYELIVNNPDHWDAILDYDSDELSKFYKERIRLNKWMYEMDGDFDKTVL